MNTALELLKYTIPALIVLISSYIIVHKFLVTQLQKKQLALLKDTQDITIRLRLQAYERFVLFIERMQPRQLIPRVYEPGMTAGDLQQALVFNIRTEFEHNLAQQIYVSRQVWETVKGVMEQELNMINLVSQRVDSGASAKELHSRIIDYIITVETELPTDVALQIINDEAKRVLSYGSTAPA